VQRAAFAGAHGDDAGQERERAGADMKHESEQRQAATSTDSGMYMSRAIQASGRWTKRKITVSIMSLQCSSAEAAMRLTPRKADSVNLFDR
jgi:hypothetical protein